jgi:hypothetical protein
VELGSFCILHSAFCIPRVRVAVTRVRPFKVQGSALDVGCFPLPFLHSAFSRPLVAFLAGPKSDAGRRISVFQLFSV